jgi:hypothetical protein
LENKEFFLLCLIQSKKCVNVCKQLPFYFYVYFEGSTPEKKTLGHCARGAPPILYVPMFPWKYFLPMKWERSEEIK